MHGVSYVEVHLVKFHFSARSGNYYVQLQIDLSDNFALAADYLKQSHWYSQWYKWIKSKAFGAWYLLQHKFNHVPLRTHVTEYTGAYLNINDDYEML